MKHLIFVLIALLMVGCSLTAEPADNPTSDPSAMLPETQETVLPWSNTETSTTTSANITVVPVDFATDSLLSSLPTSAEHIQWYTNGSDMGTDPESWRHVFSQDMTKEDYCAYVDALRAAGFTLHAQESVLHDFITQEIGLYNFYAENTDGQTVFLSWKDIWLDVHYDEIDWENTEEIGSPEPLMGGYMVITKEGESKEIPENASPATQPWESSPLRAMLPSPPTPYWTEKEAVDSCVIAVPYISASQARRYAQQLQDAGFCYQVSQQINHYFQYLFTAYNQEGYKVSVQFSALNSTGNRIVLYPPKEDETVWEVSAKHPILLDLTPYTTRWHIIDNSIGEKVCYCFGMDFEQALEYVENVRSNAEKRGWNTVDVGERVVDRENQTIKTEIVVEGSADGIRFLRAILFLYDAEGTQCPFRILF